MITIDNVSKSYASTPVLKACSTTVAKGEVVVVCGPSGSGKSTLIKCVNGLEPFQHGSITVDGISVGDPKTDLPRLRARVGMVFQHFELFPHMSVRQNLALAQVKVLGRSVEEADARGLSRCSTGSASPPTPTSFPASFPAASSSAWRSPAPWPWTRSACCSTNRPRRSTRR
jgi:ABC-type polar amino acid transport system ATPase subunit